MKSKVSITIVNVIGVVHAAVYDNLPFPNGDFQNVRDWATNLKNIGEQEFTQRFGNNAPRMPSPEFWSDHPVYQVFPDRFNNGDATNDNANIASWQRDQLNSGNLYDVATFRHGGDIKGITDRLDYLADLGIETVFTTSFFHNSDSSYHGYCVSNPLRIDPGFGTLEDLQTLVNEAHKRGMRVVIDFVLNHICDPGTRYKQEVLGQDRENCLNGRYNNAVYGTNNYVQGQGELEFGSDFFPPLKDQRFYSKCGYGSFIPDDYTPPSMSIFGDFSRKMFDFNTNDRDLWLVLTEIAKYWVASTDVDGFRLDAIKHITENLTAYFCTNIRDYALSIGKANFFITGEIVDGDTLFMRYYQKMNTDPANPAAAGDIVLPSTKALLSELRELYLNQPIQKYPGLTAVYDFPQAWDIRRAFRGEQNYFASYLANINNREVWKNGEEINNWIFMDLHDISRVIASFDDTSMRRNADAIIGALSYVNLARGTPLLYYGDEQGFNEDCYFSTMETGNAEATERIQNMCKGDDSFGNLDALHRQTMWTTAGFNLASALPEISELTGIRKPQGANPHNWQNDPMLNRQNPIYQAIRQINSVRRSCAPLRRGAQWSRPNNNGLLVFGRLYEGNEIVVFINPTRQSRTLPDVIVDYFINPDTTRYVYKNALLREEQTGFTGRKDGATYLQFNANYQLPAYRAAVFIRDDLISEVWDDASNAYLCKNDVGARMNGVDTPESSNVPMIAGISVLGIAAAGFAVILVSRQKAKNVSNETMDAFKQGRDPEA